MISDEVFSKELDLSLKRQKVLKKQRNSTIGECLLLPDEDRDAILELADRDAREFETHRDNIRNVPREDAEQISLVQWFRSSYPDKVIMLVNNDDNRQQSKNILLGLHKGASDLYIPHLHLYTEMKRRKPKDSPWSKDQQEFKRYVEEVCGDTYIIAFGCEDAKEKILNHINKMIQ